MKNKDSYDVTETNPSSQATALKDIISSISQLVSHIEQTSLELRESEEQEKLSLVIQLAQQIILQFDKLHQLQEQLLTHHKLHLQLPTYTDSLLQEAQLIKKSAESQLTEPQPYTQYFTDKWLNIKKKYSDDSLVNYYYFLGIDQYASSYEIHNAVAHLNTGMHGVNLPVEADEALDILTNPITRSRYDKDLQDYLINCSDTLEQRKGDFSPAFSSLSLNLSLAEKAEKYKKITAIESNIIKVKEQLIILLSTRQDADTQFADLTKLIKQLSDVTHTDYNAEIQAYNIANHIHSLNQTYYEYERLHNLIRDLKSHDSKSPAKNKAISKHRNTQAQQLQKAKQLMSQLPDDKEVKSFKIATINDDATDFTLRTLSTDDYMIPKAMVEAIASKRKKKLEITKETLKHIVTRGASWGNRNRNNAGAVSPVLDSPYSPSQASSPNAAPDSSGSDISLSKFTK